jgi:hypothetical protein
VLGSSAGPALYLLQIQAHTTHSRHSILTLSLHHHLNTHIHTHTYTLIHTHKSHPTHASQPQTPHASPHRLRLRPHDYHYFILVLCVPRSAEAASQHYYILVHQICALDFRVRLTYTLTVRHRHRRSRPTPTSFRLSRLLLPYYPLSTAYCPQHKLLHLGCAPPSAPPSSRK